MPFLEIEQGNRRLFFCELALHFIDRLSPGVARLAVPVAVSFPIVS